MQLFSVYASKGGCGKTTLILSFASFLQHMQKSVTIVDLDSQQSSSSIAKNWGNVQVSCGMPKSKPATQFVLFDYAPGTEQLPTTKNVILPILPGILDVKAAKQTLQALREEQNVYIVLNCYDCRRSDDLEVLNSLKSNFKNVFIVKQRAVLRRTLTVNKGIFCEGLQRYGGLAKAQNEIGYIANKIFNV